MFFFLWNLHLQMQQDIHAPRHSHKAELPRRLPGERHPARWRGCGAARAEAVEPRCRCRLTPPDGQAEALPLRLSVIPVFM